MLTRGFEVSSFSFVGTGTLKTLATFVFEVFVLFPLFLSFIFGTERSYGSGVSSVRPKSKGMSIPVALAFSFSATIEN